MVFRILAPSILVAVALLDTASAQVMVTLPAGSTATDVTPDGLIVVGNASGGGFIWRWKQDPQPTLVAGGSIVAVSDDGSVVAGNVIDPSNNKQTAAIWTQAGGWHMLGGLPGGSCDFLLSSAYDISGDGTTVVGLGWSGCSGRGFRWTAATGMQELQNLANGGNRCSAISGDGSMMGGFAQGTFNRTPAYWTPNLAGFVLDPNFQGEVYGFSENGTLSVGTLYQGSTQGVFEAFLRNNVTGAITNIGGIHSNWASAASDLSENGFVIVGFDYIGLSRQAWVWTAFDGIKTLDQRLIDLGITGAPQTYTCSAVSDDGNVIVGAAASGGFIVQLSGLVGPYGTGTPGCNGPAVLSGSPAPQVNTPNYTLSCTNAPPSSLGLWLITDTYNQAGTDTFGIGAKLHIDLFAATVLFTPNGTSDASGVGTAPVPIPNTPTLAGATFYAQVIWAWPVGSCTTNYPQPFGLSTSNGLAITIFP